MVAGRGDVAGQLIGIPTGGRAGGEGLEKYPVQIDAQDLGLDYLRDRRLDGLVIPTTSMKLQAPANAQMLNIVTIGGSPGGFAHVSFDEPMGLALVTEHLKELGHQSVQWYGPALPGSQPGVSREQAFLREAFAAGLRGRVCLVEDIGEAGKAMIEQMLEKAQALCAAYLKDRNLGRFTAVVCYSDMYALAAERALVAAGYRVPGDVSVMGFDDCWAALGQPPLTTVSHELFEMGRQAGRLVVARIGQTKWVSARATQDGAPPDSVVVKPRLVLRASTAPPPASAAAR